MGWCMENCQCHSYLHRHRWTSEAKKSEEKALHVGFTKTLPQAVVASGGVRDRGCRGGGRAGDQVPSLSCVPVCHSQRAVPFSAFCLKATLEPLLLAFASH